MGEAPTAEQLLADASWLRRLAERLAGEGEADDLVQETWIAAWQREPDTDRPLRPWLAKVMRDTFRMRRRADRRRQQRESSLDGPAPEVSPADVLEQVRLHKLLVDLVLAMGEPFRSTLLLRFVEGRTAAEIARATGVPEGTVRWRLHEALSKLRARLDEINGSRKAWAPAVRAFAKKGIAVAKTTKSLLFVIALVVLLLGSAVSLLIGFGRSDEPPTAASNAIRSAVAARGHHGPTSGQAKTHATLLANDHPPGWFAQEGVKPRRLSGQVLVDGVPASGAMVRLEDEASRVGLVPTRERRTSAEGRFDFGIQPATRYELGAYLPGRVATVKRVDLRDPRLNTENVVVLLDPCVVGIYGQVVDASGGPIAHAQLLAQGVIGTESDAKGSFDICLNAQGNIPDERRLVVRASGYGTVEMIAPLVGRIRRTFMLSPEATISGRVVSASGRPVAMANIRVNWDEAAPRPGSERPAVGHAVSAADGRFELAGLAAGRLRVQGIARGAASDPTTIEVAAGASKQVELRLSERGVLRGRVLSEGRPVAGVAVFDRAELPTYQARGQISLAINEAVSQADGTFVLDGLSVGKLSLGTSPYRLRTPAAVDIAAGEQTVDLEVEQLGAIVGTVRRNGRPMPHALVRASGMKWVNTRSTETDEAGRYVLDGLDTDDYRLSAHSPSAGAFTYLDTRIKVDHRTRTEVDLVLRYGARISGTVADADGQPVPGAFVTFQHTKLDDMTRCTTDAAGRFSCAGMRGEGDYRAAVSGSEASPKPSDFIGEPPPPIFLRDGDAHVDDVRLVVVASTLTIRGIAVDRTGKPVPDARVLANAGDSPWASLPTSVTDLHGRFELRDLSPGSYEVQAHGVDGSKTLLESVAAGTANVRVVLVPPSCDDSIDAKLGRVQREAPSSIANRPATRVAWDERIELLGWEMPGKIRIGDEFQVVLIYRVLKPIDRSWNVFIHFDGEKGRLNVDHEPLGGRCPTSTWKPGDVIVDRTSVRVDPTYPGYQNGKYDVWIGFFSGWNPSWRNMQLSAAPEPLDEFHRLKLTSVEMER